MIGVCVAIDPGTVRHGIAVSDALGITAKPIGVIDAQPEDEAIERIVQFLVRKRAEKLIMGLPVNMDGTEGPGAQRARALAARISEKLPDIEIIFSDERLTTVEAESRLAEQGMNWRKRKQHVDAASAQILLLDYLHSNPDKG